MRIPKFSLIITVTLLISAQAWARDVWIEAVGINQNLHSQNFDYFYQSAREFLDLCKSSPLHPDCYQFINPDFNLAVNPKYPVTLNLPATTTPTPQTVIELFKSKLRAARAGDTIILSLEDHGAPSRSGNSCVWLSSYDYLCDSDIKKVLEPKPKGLGLKPEGVKVFINADACFSGGFADLSSKDICIATWADRRMVGSGAATGDSRLWGQVLRSSAHSLSDLRALMMLSYRQLPTLGSQSIANIMCRPLRSSPERVTPANQQVFWSEPTFAKDRLSFDNFNVLPRFSKYLGQDISKTTCLAIGFTSATCDQIIQFQNSLKLSDLQFINFVHDQYPILYSQIWQTPLIPEHLARFDKGDIIQVYRTSRNGNFDQHLFELLFQFRSPAEREVIKSGIEVMLQFHHDQINHLKDLKKQYVSILEKYQTGPDREIWKTVEPCLFDVESFINPEELREYVQASGHGVGDFPRSFNERDIRSAEECESSIKFQ